MRKLKKPIKGALVALLLLVGIPASMTAFDFGPRPVRAAINRLVYLELATTPSNGERPGVYPNRAFDPSSSISIVIINESLKHPLGFGLGGDDTRHAAMQEGFDLRVNASSSAEAAQYIERYLTAIDFPGSIGSVTLFDHGGEGKPILGWKRFGDEVFKILPKYRPADHPTRFYFFGCNIAGGEGGKHYMQEKANAYGIEIFANADRIEWDMLRLSPEGKPNYWANKDAWFHALPGGTAPEKFTVPR